MFQRKLGAGNFGRVSQCRNRYNGDIRAIKIIKMDKAADFKDAVVETALQQKLGSEGICKIYAWGAFSDTFLYVVMEFCEQGSLMRAINEQDIAAFEYFQWVLLLSRGLKHMEALNVYHRDIKPDKLVPPLSSRAVLWLPSLRFVCVLFACLHSSVLITETGGRRVVKYTDFGFAVEVSDFMEPKMYGMCGTPGYWSPELDSGKPYSSKTDVWSLAISFTQVPKKRNQSSRSF